MSVDAHCYAGRRVAVRRPRVDSYVCVYVCIYVCLYMCMDAYVCMCMYVCMYVYVYMHVYACICIVYECYGALLRRAASGCWVFTRGLVCVCVCVLCVCMVCVFGVRVFGVCVCLVCVRVHVCANAEQLVWGYPAVAVEALTL